MERTGTMQLGPQAVEGEGDRIASLAEARLHARAAAGDRAALSEVWRANRRWIAAVLAAHAPRGADIDDLLQEVAATLVAKHHHVRDASSLRGWLRVVAINAARMDARARSTDRRALRRVADETRPSTAPARDSDPTGVLALVGRLPPIYAEPLLLQSVRGLSQRQLAEFLDVPETTIETRLARGRRMLRELAASADAEKGTAEP